MWVIFALLDPDTDPDSESESTDPIESGSNPKPDPQPCLEQRHKARLGRCAEADKADIFPEDLGATRTARRLGVALGALCLFLPHVSIIASQSLPYFVLSLDHSNTHKLKTSIDYVNTLMKR